MKPDIPKIQRFDSLQEWITAFNKWVDQCVEIDMKSARTAQYIRESGNDVLVKLPEGFEIPAE